ncbi:MAG: cation transporter [Thermoleophilia bacterium]|nr:cation transporter [Thermoleophilia bacterium]
MGVAEVERRALWWSIAVTAALGGIGIVWGILGGSQMILLDGVYAIVGIMVSLLLLWASALAQREPTRRYPFGRESVTPLVIAVQGFVLIGTLLYAAAEALTAIREGGSDITAGWAIAYGVLSTICSLAVWLWLRSQAEDSDLLDAETTAWRIAALRGVGMTIGFTAILALEGTSRDDWTPYVDPAMVLATCAIFIVPPVRMVRGTLVELLEGAPSREVEEPVRAAVEEVRAQFDLSPPTVLVTKVGRKLYVEVEGLVAPDVTVRQEEEVRAALRARLEALPFDIWLNFELKPRAGAPSA